MIEKTFKNTLKKYSLVKKGDRILLGVSGGPDSLFMLYQFLAIQKEYRFNFICVHLNHTLRKEADDEEQFIKDICSKFKVKFISESKNVGSFFNGDSLEQTARNLRFDFFLKCSRETKFKKIALAHHQDDLAETVLMRVIKGVGLKGLRGFLPKTKFKSLTVIRPLIEVNKQGILNWLESKKIVYCIDKSNLDDNFFRNRIRLKLIPLLKELNPNIIDNLSNLAYSACWDYDFVHEEAYKIFRFLKKKETTKTLNLDLDRLKKLSLGMFNNVIRIAIEELKGNTRRLELRHLDELWDLIRNRPLGSVVNLPDILIKKEQKLLIIQSLIL